MVDFDTIKPLYPTRKSHVNYVTHHWYPFGGASSYSSASAAIDAMLSASNGTKYQNFYNGWARTAQQAGFKPRLEETNSMYLGGFAGGHPAARTEPVSRPVTARTSHTTMRWPACQAAWFG